MISTVVNPETISIETVARKRRRQIIQSQRLKNEEHVPPSKKKRVEPITSSIVSSRKGSEDEASSNDGAENKSSKSKKPQMRYDPDVPMSKEEATRWRKEQRRKRNRESAAASRQRQKDRITELEEEVSEWKARYEEAIARIEKLEQMRNYKFVSSSNAATIGAPSESAAVSPCSSPRQSPSLSHEAHSSCGMVSLQDQSVCSGMEIAEASNGMHERGDHVKHLSEKISRPAKSKSSINNDMST
jgi:uncharacterized membrane protein YqiK